ncbi:MAG: thrombospondin type 3 repeat-containing protein, partial [Betaproteobacteria bacterium]
SDPLAADSVSTDTDGDSIPDCVDTDDDGDGVADEEDAFPLDASETVDTDGDEIGNNADTDDDGDGQSDVDEASCGSDPLAADSVSTDSDGDSVPDCVDTDDDNDGVADEEDAFPLDANEEIDTDLDGVGNNADSDDDNDGIVDSDDLYPLGPLGYVIKGPIAKATVFYDYNGNQILDQGEPQALTDVNGSYSIDLPRAEDLSFNVVAILGNAAEDTTTGEMYGASGVKLIGKIPSSEGAVISPFSDLQLWSEVFFSSEARFATSSLFSRALTALGLTKTYEVQLDSFGEEDLSAILGLTEWASTEILRNYGLVEDAEPLSKIENLSQQIMTTRMVLVTALISAVDQQDGIEEVSLLAQDLVMDALVKTLIEARAVQLGADSVYLPDIVQFNFSDPSHLTALKEILISDLQNNEKYSLFAQQLDGDAVEVLEPALQRSIEIAALISEEHEFLEAIDFGKVSYLATSHLKHRAVLEVEDLVRSAREYYLDNGSMTGFSEIGVVTLNSFEGIEGALLESRIPVQKHLVKINGWVDSDEDGLPDQCDIQCGLLGVLGDQDDDNDGVADRQDAFPLDSSESSDFDGDGIGDNSDEDADNDGVSNLDDLFPFNPNESADSDQDGVGDRADTDDDNDGVADAWDAFPLDATESKDSDGDAIGDNADTDDDNDGVPDLFDAFPFDFSANSDLDGDGIDDSRDPDLDGDGVSNAEDLFPTDPTESIDTDLDGIGNNSDPDDDNDDVFDGDDDLPLDPQDYRDTDGDGIGDSLDPDDDGDGVTDEYDLFPKDPSESIDTDSDGIGNNSDPDDDNDGVLDRDDELPLDARDFRDTDGDGIGDSLDPDDDGDGVLD